MNYKEVIEAKYNREAWQGLLHDIFRSKVKFWSTPAQILVSSRLAKEALSLGNISLSDGEAVAIYEVELNERVNIERNRRGIRDMLTKDWRNTGYAGAFVFSYRKNESVLRFSYVSESEQLVQGELKTVSTNTTRYTYLLGEGRGCRSAIDQFSALKNSKQTLADITAAFSVEALTKQFYGELFDWYLWAIDPKTGVSFPNNTSTESDDRDDIETKIIRMITRIMFVWFIKQKELVPNRLFDVEYLQTILKDFDPSSTDQGNYYNAILQNLFFATLNRAIKDENGNQRRFATAAKTDIKTLYRYAELFTISEQEVIDLFAEVPFLNGGLFECLDKTKTINGVEQAYNYDGFSRNDEKFADGRFKYRAVVPNALFFDEEKGLFSIFNKYNFTIEENTPEDQQIALDPELLGKVFENLLGAYNPESKKTARNQSGSFYTPREIVRYMVDESLIAYLGDSNFTRSLFAGDFEYNADHKKEYKAISDKLKEVKVLDPACGSGAFPMGLLNRMVEVLQRIEPNINVYEQKLSIIANCLYGCDLQCIATQITKLRFFISLIVDCEKDFGKPNFGIPTLPNLETKFVAADSLLGKRQRQRDLFENNEIDLTKHELAQVRHEHFMAKTSSEKSRLREQDQQLREKLAKLLAEDEELAPEDAKQLAAWNPYDQNAVSKFFDPEWMFGLSAHPFDIVIGNPPYIQLQKHPLSSVYGDCGYKTFAKKGDIYCLFYERGQQLLKDGGHLCYITSNKWMRAEYGKKTREFLAKNTNPILLIDFAGISIFKTATVDTNILLFSKSDNLHQTWGAVPDKQNQDSISSLSFLVQSQGIEYSVIDSEPWVILSPIERSIKRKLEAVGTPLKDWNIKINYGIKTGCNDAFIISTETRNEILANCQTEDERQRTEELIRPILKGENIKRYSYNWLGSYIIATFPSRHYDIDDYPSVKEYLLSFGIERLEQTGTTHIVKGEEVKSRKKTNNKWFETQDSISYWEDFSQLKIVWGNLNLKANYALVGDEFYINAPATMIVPYHPIILAVLNSKIGDFYIRCLGVTRNGGYFEYKPMFIDKLPVPQLKNSSEVNNSFQAMIDNNDEDLIEQALIKLYKLNDNEVNFLCGSPA